MAERMQERPSRRVSTLSTRSRTRAVAAGTASSQGVRCENSTPRSAAMRVPSAAAATAEKKSLPL